MTEDELRKLIADAFDQGYELGKQHGKEGAQRRVEFDKLLERCKDIKEKVNK